MNRTDRSVPAHLSALRPFVAADLLDSVDVHLVDWVHRNASAPITAGVQLAIALASWASRQGHSFADLQRVREFVEKGTDESAAARPATLTLPWPEPAAWLHELSSAPIDVVRHVSAFDSGFVDTPHPIVLHGSRVYLQRHFADECIVAGSLRSRASSIGLALSPSSLTLLDAVLPPLDHDEPSQQRAAADIVLHHHLSLVVGGPGTGKTHSVALMLAVLLHHELQNGRHLRVALVAPTGKAAARMQEAIAKVLTNTTIAPHIPPDVASMISELQPTTIHRLLGSVGGSTQRFRHDEHQQLAHDVVIVDETSMVPTPLLARLCSAVRTDARLVLLGDPDQLESVDRGRVLGDLVKASAEPSSPIAGHIVRLLRSHRFGGDSAVAKLANAVRGNKPDVATTALLTDPDGGSVVFFTASDPLSAEAVDTARCEVQPHLQEMRVAAEAGDAEEALAAGTRARVLCAHREGPHGVAEWNRLGERWLRGHEGGSTWYAGKPLLATHNDPRLGIANGDTGVVVLHDGRLLAAFQTGQGVKFFDQAQLSDIDTAYAITVHKSQGSEYDTVVVVLPPVDSPLVSRELVYTAVTRAKKRVVSIGTTEAMTACLDTPAQRMTGLADALAN